MFQGPGILFRCRAIWAGGRRCNCADLIIYGSMCARFPPGEAGPAVLPVPVSMDPQNIFSNVYTSIADRFPKVTGRLLDDLATGPGSGKPRQARQFDSSIRSLDVRVLAVTSVPREGGHMHWHEDELSGVTRRPLRSRLDKRRRAGAASSAAMPSRPTAPTQDPLLG